METSDRFERVESISGPTPLQDGRNHSVEGFGTEGRLDGETRHEGCLLISPSTSKIPQVPMAREDLGIQESSLRTTECPSCVHKASKTNCCVVEEAGRRMYFILGQHADYVSIQGGSKITASNSNRIANLTGIHNQHQEECVQANTGDRVPGILNRFTTDVQGSPEAEVRQHQEGCEKTEGREGGSDKTDSKGPGIDGGCTSSCSSGTHLLQMPTTRENQSSSSSGIQFTDPLDA